MEIVLKLSPLAQNDHLKPKLSFFWSFWNETRTETPPPFNCVFTRYGNTKIHINDEKNLDCRSSFRYGWLQSHGQIRDHDKSVYFSTVFSRSGNLRSLNCKNIAQTNKRAKGFRQIHSFCYIENFRGLFKFRTLRAQLGKNTQNLVTQGENEDGDHIFSYCSFSMSCIWLTFVPSLKKNVDFTSFSNELS